MHSETTSFDQEVVSLRYSPRLALLMLLLGAFATAQVPSAGHVVMVVEENHSFNNVIGSSQMLYLNSLVQNYGLATNYYANTHPSIGNYFMLTTGQVITNDDAFTGTVSSNNLVRSLLTAGVSWKTYAESLPWVGYVGGDAYPYVKHHNPFAYFSDVRNSATEKNNVVPFSTFGIDLANGTLPRFSFVIPNVNHDMEDCPTGPTGCTDAQKLAAADSWLKTNIAPLLADPEFQKDGLLIITWDEGSATDTANGGGRVATLIIGPKVKQGYRSGAFYQEQSVLRTVLASLGITSNLLGSAATAPLMNDFFQSSSPTSTSISSSTVKSSATVVTTSTSCTPGTTIPSVTICSPGTSSGSPMHVSAAAESSTTVGYMAVWVDGVKMYQVNTSSLDTYISASAGTHRVTVQAKDASGTLFAKTIYTTVSTGGCTPGTTVPSVRICSPGSSSSSPIQVSAAAVANTTVGYMAVWMDGVNMYQVNASSVNTSFAASAGTHRITVQATDASGYLFSSVVYTTVGSSTLSTSSTWSISGAVAPSTAGAGTSVALGGAKTASTTADANGNYGFTGLVNGTYTITPTKSGYTFSPASAAISVNGANISSINFSASATTSTSHYVSLSWAASTSTVSGYNVYRKTGSGGTYAKINSSVVGSTSYTDKTVGAGTTYYYAVTAVSSSGAESSYSNIATAVIPSP